MQQCDICHQETPDVQLQEVAGELHCNECVARYLRYGMQAGSSIIVMESDDGNAVWVPAVAKAS